MALEERRLALPAGPVGQGPVRLEPRERERHRAPPVVLQDHRRPVRGPPDEERSAPRPHPRLDLPGVSRVPGLGQDGAHGARQADGGGVEGGLPGRPPIHATSRCPRGRSPALRIDVGLRRSRAGEEQRPMNSRNECQREQRPHPRLRHVRCGVFAGHASRERSWARRPGNGASSRRGCPARKWDGEAAADQCGRAARVSRTPCPRAFARGVPGEYPAAHMPRTIAGLPVRELPMIPPRRSRPNGIGRRLRMGAGHHGPDTTAP